MDRTMLTEHDWHCAIEDAQARAASGDPEGAGRAAFERMHELLSARVQWREERLCESNGGELFGIEAHNNGTTCRLWVALLPEMSQQEEGYQARLQRYDESGLSGHSVFRTAEAALREMAVMGYAFPDPGAMDRLSRKPSWAQGMQAVQRVAAQGTREVAYG